MDDATRRAVFAAARRASEGMPVSLSDRRFWKTHGGFTTGERQDIIARGMTIANVEGSIDWETPLGTLQSLYADTPYPEGPADTQTAKLYAKVQYEIPTEPGEKPRFAFRSIAMSFDWGTPLEDVLDAFDSLMDDTGDEYGFEGGSGTIATITIA